MATAEEQTRRCIAVGGFDSARDRWTIGVWQAAASLLLCAYYYEEEGAYDAAGRWCRKRIRHIIAGLPVNQARVQAMGSHFCELVRTNARAFAKERGGCAHLRKSFEGACADRLILRLRKVVAEARQMGGDANAEAVASGALLRQAGLLADGRRGAYDRSGWDRAAARQGRAAADNISLVLRTGLSPRAVRTGAPERSQLGFAF
jgi:hypothetical protein